MVFPAQPPSLLRLLPPRAASSSVGVYVCQHTGEMEGGGSSGRFARSVTESGQIIAPAFHSPELKYHLAVLLGKRGEGW